MEYIQNAWVKIVKYLTITRILELGWNVVAFLYHFMWLGMGDWTSVIIQITALLTEWLVTGIYEDRIFINNILVNNRYHRNRPYTRFFHKYWRFTGLFIIIFVSTYFLRLLILYWIGYGITGDQFIRAMINTIPIALIAGPGLGFAYIARRRRDQKNQQKMQYYTKP